MIEFNEAIEVAVKSFQCKFLSSVAETPSCFLFAASGDNGEELTQPPISVDKETGKTASFFPPHHVKEWLARKELEIPEQYRYPGEIKY